MPAFFPNSGCLKQAGEMQTVLENSKLRLFQSSLNPSPSTLLADYVAAECDYDGYTPGGLTVTAFLDPISAPLGGAQIQAPTKQFTYVDGVGHVSNNVGGWFLCDAAGAVRAVGVLGSPVPMASNGDGLPIDVVLRFGNGQ